MEGLTCPSCAAWEQNLDSGLYHNGCDDCAARALLMSPRVRMAFDTSMVAMRFTADYMALLRMVAGDKAADREALHRKVKALADRIEQRRAEAHQ